MKQIVKILRLVGTAIIVIALSIIPSIREYEGKPKNTPFYFWIIAAVLVVLIWYKKPKGDKSNN